MLGSRRAHAPIPASAGAGEGSKLPKGLSLFRFILFSALMLGAVYGGVSLYFNSPPLPGDIPPNGIPSAQWTPNPIWLPSFLAMKFQLGIHPSEIGYIFTGRLGHAIYGSASILLGIILLGGAGWIAGENIRRRFIFSAQSDPRM